MPDFSAREEFLETPFGFPISVCTAGISLPGSIAPTHSLISFAMPYGVYLLLHDMGCKKGNTFFEIATNHHDEALTWILRRTPSQFQ